ncbi:MAG: hypothetical protein WCG87_02405 [Bacteroidota bacterium]
MVQILLAWLYIFFTSYCVGLFCIRNIEKLMKDTTGFSNNCHPVLLSMVGLVGITVVAGYMSIFLKTGLVINCLLLAFCFLYVLVKRKQFPSIGISKFSINANSVIVGLLLLSVFVLVLIKSSGPITTPDSAGYHLPFIKWIENYRAIKGTANVHTRFGFNYQYHVLYAVYSFSYLNIPTVHALNGYMMVAIVTYILTSLSFFKVVYLSRLDVMKLIMLFFVLNMGNATSSFSPDFPTATLVILAIIITLEKIELNVDYQYNMNSILMFILSIGALLFKISSAPIFLLNLFYIGVLYKHKKWNVFIALAITCFVSVAPYLIRNYILSGYLVYPLYSLDIFTVSWKVPLPYAIYEKDVIRTCALGITYGSHVPFKEMIISWWHNLKATNTAYIYIVSVLMGCMIMNIVCFLRILIKKQSDQYSGYILLFVVLYSCLLYWWRNAPDPRFGNGYIIPFIAINISLIGYSLFRKMSTMILRGTSAILILLSLVMMKGQSLAKVQNNFNVVHYNIWKQEPYPKPDTTGRNNSRHMPFYIVPNDKFCWDAPQPCSMCSDQYEYIGATIEEGFIHK